MDEGAKEREKAETARKEAEAAQKKALTPENIMHQRTGGAAGSNNGGFYEGTDGITRYIKIYGEETQAHSEVIANEIYRALGIGVPEASTFTRGGKLHYASTIIPGSDLGDQVGTLGVTQERAEKILDGFVADVLLANRDVLGLGFDNVIDVGGRIYRVDNGSAFLHRAQGARKGGDLTGIGEWESLAPGGMNSNYAQVFETAGYSSPEDMGPKLEKQLRKLAEFYDSLGDAGWAGFVDKHGPGMDEDDREAIIRMLESRTRRLVAKTGQARFYRKDQRRDYYGRWVDEGRARLVAAKTGEGGSKATTTALVEPTPAPPAPAPPAPARTGHGAAWDEMAAKYDPPPIDTYPAPKFEIRGEDVEEIIAKRRLPKLRRTDMPLYERALYETVERQLKRMTTRPEGLDLKDYYNELVAVLGEPPPDPGEDTPTGSAEWWAAIDRSHADMKAREGPLVGKKKSHTSVFRQQPRRARGSPGEDAHVRAQRMGLRNDGA